jgi:AraC-like DNA-binding protein
METIAEVLGYESEVAFRKAFKRELGISPARYRKDRIKAAGSTIRCSNA